MKYQPYTDFYMPSNKEGYIKFLYARYPDTNLNKWYQMKKERLMAIYISIRGKKG